MKTKEQLDADTLFAFQMALKGYREFEYFNETSWVQTSYVSSRLPHRIYHDIPEGWTRHDGEDWEGDKDAVIEEAIWCDGQRCATKGKKASWWSNEGEVNNFTTKPERRIYAYKLAEKKPEKKVIPWTFETAPIQCKVKRKNDGSLFVAAAFCEGLILCRTRHSSDAIFVTYEALALNYLQLDGSPCGTEVEQ